MSALAGYLDLAGRRRPADGCAMLVEELRPFGSSAGQLDLDRLSLGIRASAYLPEDKFDRQPLVTADGRHAIVFDGRIDDRCGLAQRLGIERAALAGMSDARLFLEAWEKWQANALDELVGDFAVAIWDASKERLTLARSPLSLRPLFYHHNGDALAFASLPSAIAALPDVGKSLDWDALAALASGAVYRQDRSTLFRRIHKVLPGEAVEFHGGRMGTSQPRKFDAVATQPGGIEELGERLRQEFDRAIASQIRRASGNVASHLSAGRDSSAVTVTAASLLESSGDQLIALTAAPRTGFDDGAGRDWLIDESDLAAATAGAYSNVRHHICRPDGSSIMTRLDALHRHHFTPLMNLSNMPWAIQLDQTAQRLGASVLLTGSNGNFSISNGGNGYLVDLLNEDGPVAWWREARRAGGISPTAWLALLHQVIGPWMSLGAYHGLRIAAGLATPASAPLPTLARPLRQRAEAFRAVHFRDWRPPRSYRQLVNRTLDGIDDAQIFSQALWGVDVRDPTSDRRIVELCLSVPARTMFSTDSDRPIYEAAFASRLPPSVLRNRKRGYQCADWFERFHPEQVRASLRQYLANPLVREIVDGSEVEKMIDRWPTSGWADSIIEPYRNQLLPALAIASFVDTHFPD